MAKKSYKKIRPLIPNPSGNYFVDGGSASSAAGAASGAGGIDFAGIAGKAIQGGMDLTNLISSNLDTSNVGKEVVNTRDITRNDLMTMNTKVDSGKSSVGGGFAQGAKAGLVGLDPTLLAATGGLSALLPVATSLAGGVTSIFGNEAKEKVAERAQRQWGRNIDAKAGQFQYQDMRNAMANISANGGELFAYGGNIDKNKELVEFNEGGTHEQNPNDGIMQGTGANGKPNLVEEGETKHEDYIFSDRLKVTPQVAKSNNLPNKTIGKTFADASKFLNKEAKERPNDPISMNAVKADLSKLTQAQEMIKANKGWIRQKQSQDANIMEGGNQDQFFHGGDLSHFTQGVPTGHQIYAGGGNLFDGESGSSEMDFSVMGKRPGTLMVNNNDEPWQDVYVQRVALTATSPTGAAGAKYIADLNSKGIMAAGQKDKIKVDINRSGFKDKVKNVADNDEPKVSDYLRYAPVIANMSVGLNDILQKPEVVSYGRISPELLKSRMDYQPVDTEWMANRMRDQFAATRSNISNLSGGNRATAMAGLYGINKQQNEALGQQYLQAQDINYGRKNQALQFNAGIEAQNIAARNAAQQQNIQLAMQEADMNARNRAAKRNAARQAIIQSAQDLGAIGRENWAAKTGSSMYGYSADPITGKLTYNK